MPDPLGVVARFDLGIARFEASVLARFLDDAFVADPRGVDLGRLSLVYDRLSGFLAGSGRYAVLPLNRVEVMALHAFLVGLLAVSAPVVLGVAQRAGLSRLRRRLETERDRLI